MKNGKSTTGSGQGPLVNQFIIFVSILMSVTLLLAETNEEIKNITSFGTIAYISSENGRDAIILRQGNEDMTVYVCSGENEIILTPKVTIDGKYISFLVDDGSSQRVLHLLGPIENYVGTWSAIDSVVTVVKGGAWPNYGQDQIFYLSMQNPDTNDLTLASDIYQIQDGKFTRINENEGLERHLWPLISPNGQQLHYRKISIQEENMHIAPRVNSIIYDLNSQTQEVHLADQNIFIEQWAANGMILYYYKVNDVERTRVYSLYDPKSRESKEIYQHSSRQARLSPDARFLATLRTYPAGSSQFDIFIINLETQQEINLTQTPQRSESLIDWIK